MSNRDSLGFGDLIPHDVVEIFAQEKHHKKGRKKRSHSLGRALGWLKGKKRKDLGANGQNPGLGPALDLALDGHVAAHLGGNKGGHKSGKQTQTQGNSHAALNLHDDKTPTPPLLQENVFIEASRPKYLEDLHIEALEGLKMMQQEDNNAGLEFQDNESTTSTMTAQTDGEGGGFTTDSTIPDASSVASMQSSVSRRSSRSGLTRQGSTFRPLNFGKQSEKGRTRRRHRKTVGGIPPYVQRELGMEQSLDRVGRTRSSKLEEEEHLNGKSDGVQQGESQSGENVVEPISDAQICPGHVDDLALLHRLGPDLIAGQRPQSFAVPSMTTANSLQQEMPSPVMSMSPQAAYMSKIIPNAVLPPSIEVVEISRGHSRNSVRTVSKSSLLLSSPSPSRTSCRTTSSRASKLSSACNHNPYNLSDTSAWSHSESSETLVSDSSTISSGNISRKEASQDSSKIRVNGKVIIKERGPMQEGPFVRSLSVMKPKRAPPPPNRSHSLHKMKRRSRDLAEVAVIPKESPPQSSSALGGGNDEPEGSPVRTIDSPGYNGDMSSLDDSTGSVLFRMAKSPQANDSAKAGKVFSSSQETWKPPLENKVNKVTSPSSGYSSQECTSPPLEICISSPKRKKGILAKLQRLFPGTSSPSSLTQLETNENKMSVKSPPERGDCETASPSVSTLRELFDIPPHPKVHAPPAPPPEVWAHNKRTFELLLGPPAPDNVYAIIKKNPKDRRQQRSSQSVSTEGSVKSLAGERKQKNLIAKVESTNGIALGTQKVHESALLNVNEVHKIGNERLAQNVNSEGNGKVKVNDEKVRVSDILNGMLVKAVEKREERLAGMKDSMGKSTPAQASAVTAKMDIIHTLSLMRTSPSPSPPPAHFPPEPPGKQTTQANNLPSPESSWPPPPPPIIQMVSVPDELDFPLPPPPLIAEGGVAGLPTSPPNSRHAAVNITERHSSRTTPTIIVTTEPEPPKSVTSHEIGPPPPLSIPPPPAYAAPPPPITANISMRMKEVIASPPKEVPPPTTQTVSPSPPDVVPAVLAKESAPAVVQVLPSLIPKDIPRPLVNLKEDAPPQVSQPTLVPPETVSALCTEEVVPPSSQESNSQTREDHTVASKLYPPESIPPPPPSESPNLNSDVTLQEESISSESRRKQISCNSILTPPPNIPPPLPLELLPSTEIALPNTDGLHMKKAPVSLLSSVSIQSNVDIPPSSHSTPPLSIPVPPPLPAGGLGSVLHQTSTASPEKESPEPSSVNVQEEHVPVVTPSLLQMVKLRPLNSSPEPSTAHDQAQDEAVLRIKQPSNLVQSPQHNNEAPQKPIRRSLIVSSPTSTSPPAIVTSQPGLPQPQTVVVVPPAPSPTALRSPALSTSPAPSMNLQEAIRLRTAARSKDSSALRLSLHSPTSPKDHRQSPTSTASFIFSKSNKRVGLDSKTPSQRNQDISTSVVKEVETKKVKMPPPVAHKPKTKAMDVETSDGMEQTAGQPAQTESIMDAAEKSNGAETGDAGGGAT